MREETAQAKEEAAQLKEEFDRMAGETTSRVEESRERAKEVDNIAHELESVRSESSEMARMVEFLKNENEILKKSFEDTSNQRDLTDHYQKLSELRFRECSALAEEIICLRTDLDRSHSNYLRVQREHSSGKKMNGDLGYSGKKLRQGGGDLSSTLLGSGISMAKPNKWSEHKIHKWTDDVDDLPPLPSDMKALPAKQDTAEI